MGEASLNLACKNSIFLSSLSPALNKSIKTTENTLDVRYFEVYVGEQTNKWI